MAEENSTVAKLPTMNDDTFITGFYVGITGDDGKNYAVDIATLNDKQIREFINRTNFEKRGLWLTSLIQWIRDNTIIYQSGT